MKIYEIVQKQREYYNSGITKNISFRLRALKKLKKNILIYESQISEALYKDLNKSAYESYMTEIGIVLNEINFFLKNTRKWSRKKYVRTPIAQFAGTSFEIPEPYGVVLIISPWNYPFQLSITPLIGAIAAGNCAIIKPSEYAPNTTKVICNIIKSCFPSYFIKVIPGDMHISQGLLEQKFDYIFFTGSARVGKLVMEKASKYLTPVSLELGGKSPCIVDKTANIRLAAKRIAFGKFLNAGQTCVAPDYIYVHKDIKKELITYLKRYIALFFGDNPLENSYYPKIINEKHYNRIIELMKGENIIIGGYGNQRRQIAPTILDNITPSSKIMEEEIFGPVLPILTYDRIQEVVKYVGSRSKPLALYIFTKDIIVEKYLLKMISFGGGCINDTIIHVSSPYLGFGGVGESGMGSYHGKRSFETFSHLKSIMKKANWVDLPIRYHPYTKKKEKFLKTFLR